MYKIQTLNKIAAVGLDVLPRDSYEIASEMPSPDAIIVRSQAMHDMALSPSLKAIARAGAGVNNIPIDLCSRRGIVVFNTPGANANGVKELVIAGMVLASRHLVEGVVWARGLADKGDEVPQLIEKGKKDFGGTEIKGKRLGVIGLGAIGVMVANAAVSLGMTVSGYDPFISVASAWGLSSGVRRAISLDMLIAESDYLSIHVPLSDKTRGMINADKFPLMKKGVVLLNFARGGLVDNASLKEAIARGTVGAYVTDFPDADLLATPRVIPIPHLGASTEEAEDNCAIMAASQIKDFLETGATRNAVNFPDCELPFSGATRLVVGNRNIPNMVGQITNILAEKGLNIADMLNKHKGDNAYNIIDIDGSVEADVLDRIRAVDGVIMVRAIPVS